VIVSSTAHAYGALNWDELNKEELSYSFTGYGRSKLANILHAKELARRLNKEKAGITVYALHPGKVSQCNTTLSD
jgi:WW domain-containing oxidoreductase